MQTLWQDLKYGFRMLAKQPTFTFIAVITLALGIGANAAIFSVVNSLLLRPLPYKDADKIVWIWETNPSNNVFEETASPPNFADWKAQAKSLEVMAASARTAVILTNQGEPERIPGLAVTDGFFSVLKAQPKLGRVFSTEEDLPNAQRTVVLSEGLWQRRFGSDEKIIGKTITLNGNPCEVVGVMPKEFSNPRPDAQAPELWVSFRLDYAKANRRGDFLGVIARLKDGISIKQAQAEMDTITANLSQQYPVTNTNWGARVLTLHERILGDVNKPLLVLMAAVCFLLLIACANVANLMLVRANGRRKEIAIRAAIGASRWRVFKQMLTESVVLSLLGGICGLLLAVWGVGVIVSLLPENMPRVAEITLDNRVLLFTLSVSLLTGIIFGLVPAWQAANPQVGECLKEGGREGADGAKSNRIRNVFAVVEIALALVLLVGAGLMVRSFMNLQKLDPGFDSNRILTTQIQLPSARYKEDAQLSAFANQLIEKVNPLPDVESVALMSDLPLSGGSNYLGFGIEGKPQPPGAPMQDAIAHSASPDYFKTMSIQLKRGRLFTNQDDDKTQGVVVINETMAKRYWKSEDPLNKRITTADGVDGPWMTVIGIVEDVRHESLNENPYPQMYSPFVQQPSSLFYLVIKTKTDTSNVIGSVRNQVKELDSNIPVFNIKTMEEILSTSVARQRFSMLLILVFAVLALLLAAIGIYGVISYAVTQRQHEIGVRMALGARDTDILRMVIKQGFKLVLIGIGIGLVAVFALTRLIKTLLFGVSATDPLTFSAIAILLSVVALLACYIPARRATKTDPMIALRCE